MLTDAVLGFFAMEQGFLFTLTAFVRRPRSAFEAYLGTERLRFSNPLKLVVFLVALATFLNYQIGTFDATGGASAAPAVESSLEGGLTAGQRAELNQFVQRNFNLLVLAALPLMATVSRLVYWRRAYNWMEHVALNAFILAVTTAAYVLQLFPALGLPWVGTLYAGLTIGYQTWSYRRVLGPGWGRALIATMLSTAAYFVVFRLGLAAWIAVTS